MWEGYIVLSAAAYYFVDFIFLFVIHLQYSESAWVYVVSFECEFLAVCLGKW